MLFGRMTLGARFAFTKFGGWDGEIVCLDCGDKAAGFRLWYVEVSLILREGHREDRLLVGTCRSGCRSFRSLPPRN